MITRTRCFVKSGMKLCWRWTITLKEQYFSTKAQHSLRRIFFSKLTKKQKRPYYAMYTLYIKLYMNFSNIIILLFLMCHFILAMLPI